LAVATIAVVACAVIGSVTVLPAVLELLGPRIDRGRIPFLPHLETDTSRSRFWPAAISRVLRRPVLSCVVAGGLLIALAVPALRLHVAKPSDEALASQNIPALRALADVRRAFPAAGEPARVVATVPAPQAGVLRVQGRRLIALSIAHGITHRPIEVTSTPDGTAAALELALAGAGDNSAS